MGSESPRWKGQTREPPCVFQKWGEGLCCWSEGGERCVRWGGRGGASRADPLQADVVLCEEERPLVGSGRPPHLAEPRLPPPQTPPNRNMWTSQSSIFPAHRLAGLKRFSAPSAGHGVAPEGKQLPLRTWPPLVHSVRSLGRPPLPQGSSPPLFPSFCSFFLNLMLSTG